MNATQPAKERRPRAQLPSFALGSTAPANEPIPVSTEQIQERAKGFPSRVYVGERMTACDFQQAHDEASSTVELIDGVVYHSAPRLAAQEIVASRLALAMRSQLHPRLQAICNDIPIEFPGDSRPAPDLTVLRGPLGRYKSFAPRPADVLLIIEISIASLSFERTIKLPLYAERQIPDVWIVQPYSHEILIFSNPSRRQQRYRKVESFRSGIIDTTSGLSLKLDAGALLR